MYPKKFTNAAGATASAQDAVQEKFLLGQGYYEAGSAPVPAPLVTSVLPTKKPGMFSFVVFHHTPTAHLSLTESPALVHTVRLDGSLLLYVFGTGGLRIEDNVKQGTEPGQWSWPL
jgi:hypothetical protein